MNAPMRRITIAIRMLSALIYPKAFPVSARPASMAVGYSVQVFIALGSLIGIMVDNNRSIMLH